MSPPASSLPDPPLRRWMPCTPPGSCTVMSSRRTFCSTMSVRGEELAPAADRYALGCVAFECFAGQPPFAGRGMMATGLAHLQDQPADPLAGRSEAPAGLGDVVCLALEKEPDRRPPTAVAYAQLLLVAARSV